MSYSAPTDEIIHCLNNIAGLPNMAQRPGFENFDEDLIRPILEEAGKLAVDVLAPLNSIGDRQGCTLVDGVVTTPEGFADAYRTYCNGGWLGLSIPEKWGGQGLPGTLSLAVMEMVHSANMSFGLCPLLSRGAIEALIEHGSEELQNLYLPKLVSGEWTGTMNLTEAQAGSDVGALKTKAVPASDGCYEISGQKIFITYGEHDMAENIVHLVLARLPDAPSGSGGISLFLVPKFIPDADGAPRIRNGVKCIGIEHKMGIHASPTCVMEYDNAKGWLIGEANRGLACMFTMMNAARLQVGLQGVGIAEAATQAALGYAKERRQGKSPTYPGEGSAPIIWFGDVQRNLMTMLCRTAASRAICYACAAAADLANTSEDAGEARRHRLREEVLTPIAKAWSTDAGLSVASLGVQIFGGMGFMAETSVAQHYKDARIAPIYEGTNGIQAADLVGRKLKLDGGSGVSALLREISENCQAAAGCGDLKLSYVAEKLRASLVLLSNTTEWMQEQLKNSPEKALCVATPYLDLFGDVVGAHYLLKGAYVSASSNESDKRKHMLRFYSDELLSLSAGKAQAIQETASVIAESGQIVFGMEAG